MDTSRNYILDRMRSRQMTQDEFDFEKLTAPPLSALLSPWDIAELNQIAKSLKLSAKPEERYNAIDKVMKRRGFLKLGSGTNRVVYRHPEDTRFVLKIASDNVGLNDNPAEYRNQFIFKPFVTKCFEISPCGTVGVFERVNPITSREEFFSVADDIFELINEWFIGEYVLADIGSTFFMNYGIRKGLGPVLLDYPYIYKLDGNKLFCNAPNHNSPTGKCDGVIDYDDGYNFLKCTKCGVRYKAKELRKKIENQEIINIKKEGEIKMKITISGGSKAIDSKVVTNNSVDEANSISNSKPVIADANRSVFVPALFGNSKKKPAPIITEKLDKPEVKKEVKKVVEVASKEVELEVKEPVVETNNTTVSDSDTKKKLTVNGASENKRIAESPISFDNDLKYTTSRVDLTKKSPVECIDEALYTIGENFRKIDIQEVRKSVSVKLLESLFNIDNDNFNINKYALTLIDKLTDLIDYVDDDDAIQELIISVKAILAKIDNIDISEEDNEEVEVEEEKQENVESEEEDTSYRGMHLYKAKLINICDIFPDEEPDDIIVMYDDNDRMVCDENRTIYGINNLDDKLLSSSTFISKDYFNEMSIELANFRAEYEDEIEEVDSIDEDNAELIGEDGSSMSEVRSDMFNLNSEQPAETAEEFAERIEAESKAENDNE